MSHLTIQKGCKTPLGHIYCLVILYKSRYVFTDHDIRFHSSMLLQLCWFILTCHCIMNLPVFYLCPTDCIKCQFTGFLFVLLIKSAHISITTTEVLLMLCIAVISYVYYYAFTLYGTVVHIHCIILIMIIFDISSGRFSVLCHAHLPTKHLLSVLLITWRVLLCW